MTTGTATAGAGDGRGTAVVLSATIVAVTAEVPRVLVVRRVRHDLATPAQRGDATADLGSPDTLPFGPFEPARHRTLDSGLRRWVAEQTGLELRYVEQLYTFGDRWRDPRECGGGPRVLSVAYLALTQESPVTGSGDARWRDWYGFLPWEDWRAGRPAVIGERIAPALESWADGADTVDDRRQRDERAAICFGLGAAPWDPARTLERYELLYETGLVPEAWRDRLDRGEPICAERAAAAASEPLGCPMALDNRRILATALGRVRGKLAYRPLVFDLLPGEFTLFRLQRVVEALTGQRLHKQNFRRTLASSALVEPTGRVMSEGRGRPAELYRFRRAVLRAKPATGVALPTLRPPAEA